MQLLNIDEKIAAFHAAIVRGKEALEEAGVILVELLDSAPTGKDRIMETFSDITPDTLETFERIGRRQLYYKLCLQDSPGLRALRRCPYSEQVKYASEGLPMLVLNGGAPDDLLVPVNALNREQTRQVFTKRRVRSLAEQRAWLQANKPRPKTIETAKPYTVHHGRITFHEAVTLTTADLARLLAEIA